MGAGKGCHLEENMSTNDSVFAESRSVDSQCRWDVNNRANDCNTTDWELENDDSDSGPYQLDNMLMNTSW